MPRTKLNRHPMEKLRLANELRSTRGFLDRRVRVTNSVAETRKSATSATVIGEVQPCFGASLIAISSATNAAAPSAKERKSRRLNWSMEGLCLGKARNPTDEAINPAGTLIRNSQGHE